MPRTRRLLPALLALCVTAPLAACGGSDDAGGATAAASASGPVDVVASAYPFAWLAERVGGADAKVTNLVKPGAEPHDLELSPQQVALVGDAAVLVYLKGFQPAVDEAAGSAPETARLDLAGPAQADAPGEEAGAVDPHVWLDPVRMGAMATAVGERLATRDPEHAAAYRERATATASDLTALDGVFRDSLQSCARTDIVTSHTAFAYLAQRYGLRQVGITGLSPDAEPSPGRIAEVSRYAKEHGVTTIFFESLVDPKVARTVADEAGAQTAVLDPVEGVAGGDDYLSVMRRNAASLSGALGCR